MTVKRSTMECIQLALGTMIIDFRNWCMPDTMAMQDWKRRPLDKAILIAPGRMIDDAQAMLNKHRQANDSRQLPIMIGALAAVATPPDLPNMIGIPYWINTVIPTDPQQRKVKFRTIPRQFRMQLVFIAADPHTVQSVLNQFCSYMTDNEKRRVMVNYDLGGGVSDEFHLTVLENTLYPDTSPTDASNITIGSIDFNCIGLLPQVVGLDPDDADVDASGRDAIIDPNNPNTSGEWGVVVQSDLYNPDDKHGAIRANYDLVQDEATVGRMPLDDNGQVIE